MEVPGTTVVTLHSNKQSIHHRAAKTVAIASCEFDQGQFNSLKNTSNVEKLRKT